MFAAVRWCAGVSQVQISSRDAGSIFAYRADHLAADRSMMTNRHAPPLFVEAVATWRAISPAVAT